MALNRRQRNDNLIIQTATLLCWAYLGLCRQHVISHVPADRIWQNHTSKLATEPCVKRLKDNRFGMDSNYENCRETALDVAGLQQPRLRVILEDNMFGVDGDQETTERRQGSHCWPGLCPNMNGSHIVQTAKVPCVVVHLHPQGNSFVSTITRLHMKGHCWPYTEVQRSPRHHEWRGERFIYSRMCFSSLDSTLFFNSWITLFILLNLSSEDLPFVWRFGAFHIRNIALSVVSTASKKFDYTGNFLLK